MGNVRAELVSTGADNLLSFVKHLADGLISQGRKHTFGFYCCVWKYCSQRRLQPAQSHLGGCGYLLFLRKLKTCVPIDSLDCLLLASIKSDLKHQEWILLI